MKNKISKEDKIFIAGSKGMVGRAVHKEFLRSQYGKEKNGGCLFTPSRNKLDLRKDEEVRDWFILNKPSIVVVAAAKVGGIYANSHNPADFILDNLRIQNSFFVS